MSLPRHHTSIQEHGFSTRSLAREATEDISGGVVKKRSKKAMTEGLKQQVQEDLTIKSTVDQHLEGGTVHSNSEQLGLLPKDDIGKSANQDSSELNHELVPESVNSETLAGKQKPGIHYFQNGRVYTGPVDIDHLVQCGQPSEAVSKNSNSERLTPQHEDTAVNIHLEQLTTLPDSNHNLKQIESSPVYEATNAITLGGRDRGTSKKSKKGKHTLKSSLCSTRVLRLRSQEKPKAPEPINNLPKHSNGTDKETRRKKSKNKRVKETPVNEFSRIRKHLRYLLHRWAYEQNLIDAYSGEGWKGQSLEKLKPEKELQRAKSEIFRCKLKIRDLFQRLDLSIAEGSFPASLFDSEGQIDSEDIFCAKCGSAELPVDNDIILCDGACERGFHQFCLQPPLLKDDIPPDDEGWLCPGCDCKVDCIELLNDSQGTCLSIVDKWEKVFPEAGAASAASDGNKLDDNLGLPSDDSEDNEYDPCGSEVAPSDDSEDNEYESDFYTASGDTGASPNSKRNLDLSSDDSEDNEYDPDAPDLDEQVKQESSSSDFTSDSDDFHVVFDNTKPIKVSNGERPKVGHRKHVSVNDELSSLLKLGPGQGAAPVSGKRNVEKLDYKKLHDDTYGNVSSDSSDENWMDAPKKKRTCNTEKVASPVSSTPIEQSPNAKKQIQEESVGHTPRRRARKKTGTHSSLAKCGSTTSSTEKPARRRLGEAVTQGLLKSFTENQYPERSTSENLAKELGITIHQVRKWFENARWSFRHSKLQDNSSTTPQKNHSEIGKRNVEDAGVTIHNSAANLRGGRSGMQLESVHTEETQKEESAPVDLPKAQDVQKRERPTQYQTVRRSGRAKKR